MDQKEARALLGLTDSFTGADLDQAFRAKALAHHPDRGGDPEAMKRLVEAKATVLKPVEPDITVDTATWPESRSEEQSSEPMDRIAFATVSIVLLVPVAVLLALVVITLVVVSSAR